MFPGQQKHESRRFGQTGRGLTRLYGYYTGLIALKNKNKKYNY